MQKLTMERFLPGSHQKRVAQAGFTLIELSVVVAILAVLSIMGLRFYKGQLYKSKINDTNLVAFGWSKAMRQWKTQQHADDFTFLANLASDQERKDAFGYYAFSLDDSRNPWGKKPSTGQYYSITLSTDNTCGGLIANHNCGVLTIEVQSPNAALEIAKLTNEQLNILDANGEGKTQPAAADIQKTDPLTNEPYYREMWASADGTTAAVTFYAP